MVIFLFIIFALYSRMFNKGVINIEKKDSSGLGKRIEAIRLNLGLNKKEFGALFDASGSLVSKWEKGAVTPAPERLKAIAEKGNMTIEELSEGSTTERINAIINIFNNEFGLDTDEESLRKTIEYFERNPIDFLGLPDVVLFFYKYFKSENSNSIEEMSKKELIDFINISSDQLIKRFKDPEDSIGEDELAELSLKLHHLDYLYESLLKKMENESNSPSTETQP